MSARKWNLTPEEWESLHWGRFMKRVKKNADTGCWEWTGARWRNGYGQFNVSKTVCVKAHRWIAERRLKDWDPKLMVCHRCDNPPCVNPEHLFMGTQKDNVRDMQEKGRGRYIQGDDRKDTKLSSSTVSEIKTLILQGETDTRIFKKFQHLMITKSCIRSIRDGRTWKHVLPLLEGRVGGSRKYARLVSKYGPRPPA